MAIARKAPNCYKCGKKMKGVYRKSQKSFVGDNFIRWEHDGECTEETEEYKKFKSALLKLTDKKI